MEALHMIEGCKSFREK